MEVVSRTIHGYCPKQQANSDIIVEFKEFIQLGGQKMSKKCGYHCEYASQNGCSITTCPIYQTADSL